jgi:serine/threonine protein kinase
MPAGVGDGASQGEIKEADLAGWKSTRKLGQGSFGATYEALLKNGQTVACKVIEFGKVQEPSEMDVIRNEIAVMKRLQHRNIVQYYGSVEDSKTKTINIFMELITGGSLDGYIEKVGDVPLAVVKDWTRQICSGIKYLHEQHIVHRDIKGANVLITKDGVLKLADFGCSKEIDEVCSKTHGCQTMVGTPFWMAPEVLKCEGYGMKSDIWSIGITICEMLTGNPPWPASDNMWAAVYRIANSTGLPPGIPADLPPELMSFLTRCFEREPAQRATAVELLAHPFIA